MKNQSRPTATKIKFESVRYSLKTFHNCVHWEEFESEDFESAIEKAIQHLRGVAHSKAVLSEVSRANFYTLDANIISGPYKGLHGVDVEDFLYYEQYFRGKGFKQAPAAEFRLPVEKTVYYKMLGIVFYITGDIREVKSYEFS